MDVGQFQELLAAVTQLFNRPAAAAQPVQPPPAAFVANFPEFDAKAESFANYIKRFTNFVSLRGVQEDRPCCAKVLLNSIGATTFETVSLLAAPVELSGLPYDELIKTFEKFLAPKRNSVVAQHQFLQRKQTSSIAAFVATLRADIGDCQFVNTCQCGCNCDTPNNPAEFFLRAQFIRGIQSSFIREQLLQAEPGSFAEVVGKALALEAAKKDSTSLHQSTMDQPDINKVKERPKKSRGRSQQRDSDQRGSQQQQHRSQSRRRPIDYKKLGIDGLCLRCGRDNHRANDCRVPRENVKCTACGKTGHVKKVCVTTLLKESKTTSKPGSNQVSDNFDYGVQNVHECNAVTDHEKFMATVFIDDQAVNFEVDSGSACTFLPYTMYRELDLTAPLVSTEKTFRAYTSTVFKPHGIIRVPVRYQNVQLSEEMYIVPDGFSALLGRTWIRRLGINLSHLDEKSNTVIGVINNINSAEDVLRTFADLFDGNIGCVPDFTVKLQLRPKATPSFCRERDIPFALRETVDKELDSLEAAGIISKIDTSDWGSPLVVIPKAGGGVRLCVDYKVGVNERLTGAHYPIRRIDSIFDSLRNSKYFCRLDLYKAYLHLRVDEESSRIQCISTHRGTYAMHRLSFGIKTAPSEFNRIIEQILHPVPKTESYFDDIIVHGTTLEETQVNLTRCLEQLRKFDLHLNKTKCTFFHTEIEFLGHKISHNKISKAPSKIEAVVNMPRPTSIDGIRTFLGLVTYYSKFIPNLSSITAPLRKLTSKQTKFFWSAECESAFIRLKQEVASDRVLVPFDPKLPVTLACDAGPFGIGAVLSHTVTGDERPIAYASRSLTSAEQNYSQLDREALAIIFAVDRFYQYLFGRKFILVTDNAPLGHIFKENAQLPRMTSARLQRYAAFLSGFNYQIQIKKGVDNSNADALSRLPIEISSVRDRAISEEVAQVCLETVAAISTLPLSLASIVTETKQDPELSAIIEKLRTSRDPDTKYTIVHDALFRGTRVVVPMSLRPLVLQELHHTHLGITKMKQLARQYVYWHQIDSDIERVVRSCDACAQVQNAPPKVIVHPWQEPTGNWERVHIDYAGPFRGHQFLVVIDAKSKWLEIDLMTAAPTAETTINMLNNIFARNGYPEVLVSDNATIFTCPAFRTFCAQAGITQKLSAPGHPATNGLAERTVQTLKQRLTKMGPGDVRAQLREMLFRYRATPLAAGKSPAELYLNRQLRTTLSALTTLPQSSSQQEGATKLPASRVFVPGDRVLVRYYGMRGPKWRTGTIKEKLGNVTYLAVYDGQDQPIKRHVNQLKATGIAPPSQNTEKQEPTVTRKTVTFELPLEPLIVNQRQDDQVTPPGITPAPAPVPMSPGPQPPVIRQSTRVRHPPPALRDYEVRIQ